MIKFIKLHYWRRKKNKSTKLFSYKKSINKTIRDYFFKNITPAKAKDDQSESIYVPKFLEEFVKSKLEIWLENAIRANNEFHKDIHY